MSERISRKVTITITDDLEGGKINAVIEFDPALKPGQRDTPALEAASRCLDTLRQMAAGKETLNVEGEDEDEAERAS